MKYLIVFGRSLVMLLFAFGVVGNVFALKSDEKSPEELAADNEKKSVAVYNEGVKHVDKAKLIGQKGDSAYAFNYRATSDAKVRKELEKAVENFQEAVQLKPAFPEAYNNLGYCYRKLGKVGESLAAYDKALELKPDFPQAREYRGETYLALGYLSKAQDEHFWLVQAMSPFADTLAKAIEVYQLSMIEKKAGK